MKRTLVVLAVVFSAFWPQFVRAQNGGAADPVAPAASVLAKFVDAFNRHDAAAIGTLLDADVEYVGDGPDGRLEGRDAVVAAYAALFAAEPKCLLSVDADKPRLLTADTASAAGRANVTRGDGATTASEFTATLVKRGEAWLFAVIHESDLPTPPTAAAEHLAAFDWLLGRWSDQSPKQRVVNDFRRTAGGSFLKRSYRREAQTGAAHAGTQLIGWDEEQQTFRCWLFAEDGSFGEGYVEETEPGHFVNKLVLKLADGRRAALTQVVERQGEDKYLIRSVDAEIDGEAQPNTDPVTMTRIEGPIGADQLLGK